MEKNDRINLIFFVKELNNGIGGMEVHQRAFIDYFKVSTLFRLYVVEKANLGMIVYMTFGESLQLVGIQKTVRKGLFQLKQNLDGKTIVFINDFWWIETIPLIRREFNNSKIFIRSGGNDIEKMPWNIGDFSYEKRLELCKKALNQVDGIIVNSKFSQKRFISHGIPSKKTIIIRGGVNTVVCDFVAKRREMINQTVRMIYGITSPYLFAFACRLVPFKGILLALEAIRQSPYKDLCHLLFLGDGELMDELRDYCQTHGLNTSFLGALPNEDVLNVLGACDLLINTSLELVKSYKGHSYIHTETMGRSMMEAISVHTPIIATNVGGIPELFKENNDIGILADCSVEAISSAIEIALKHQFTFRTNIDYSWNNVFNSYSSIFNSK